MIILTVDDVGSDFSKFEVLEANKPRKLFLEKIQTTGSFPKTTTLPRFVCVCTVELTVYVCHHSSYVLVVFGLKIVISNSLALIYCSPTRCYCSQFLPNLFMCIKLFLLDVSKLVLMMT